MQQRNWLGHPRGVFLVSFTELWERFSYWGMAGLLVLYLTASPASGGWGWDEVTAIRFYGWYGGLAFVLPVVGAWIANNYLGERRCIVLGGSAIVAGHALLASPAVLEQVALGRALFMLGLALIVLGTGLLKPTISSIVMRLYPAGDARRDEGFSLFFVAIYVGALLGTVVVGYLGERVGWHYGLAVAAVGMTLGLAVYLAKQQQWLGDAGRAPVRQLVRRMPLTAEERDRVRVLFAQGVFTVAYATAFYQMFGMLNLYARDHLDRRVLGFEVPTTWLQTVSLWSFFLCVPALAWIWRKLAHRERNPSASWKLVLGLFALAAGYLVLLGAESAHGTSKPSLLWMVGAYALFGLGDALVWANQISLASKLAPPGWSVAMIGGWYICIGLGTWLTGYVGSIAGQLDFKGAFFTLACGCFGAALLLAALTPMLRRRMHGAELLGVAT